MDFTSSSSQWIWAVKSGSAVKSDSVSTHLSQHEGQGSFKLDLTQARGGDSVNPFVDSGSSSTGSGNSSSSAAGGSTDGSSDGSSGSSSGGSSGGAGEYAQLAKKFAKRNKAVIAHGTIMGLAFALLFPSGSIMIRLLSFTGLVWVHAGVQMLAYALAIAGMGYVDSGCFFPLIFNGLSHGTFFCDRRRRQGSERIAHSIAKRYLFLSNVSLTLRYHPVSAFILLFGHLRYTW